MTGTPLDRHPLLPRCHSRHSRHSRRLSGSSCLSIWFILSCSREQTNKASDETFCTNGNCYETDNGEDYFDNFDDCCAKLVVDGNIDADDKCKREDICNPTKEPTEAPTAPAPMPIPVSLSLCLPLFIHHQLFSP